MNDNITSNLVNLILKFICIMSSKLIDMGEDKNLESLQICFELRTNKKLTGFYRVGQYISLNLATGTHNI